MERLPKHFAIPAAARLSDALSEDNRLRLTTLADGLNDGGVTTVGEAQTLLFPAVSTASANKAFDRLMKAVNAAAEAREMPLRLVIDADKKLSTARKIWFEGDPLAPEARTSTLNAVDLVEEQYGAIEVGTAVALLTFNEHEYREVRARFADLGAPVSLTENTALLGRLHGVAILHRHSLGGQAQTRAALAAADVIHGFRATAVIAVGITCGLKTDAQSIGDVLVTTSVTDLELRRLNKDGSVTPRGDSLPATSRWQERFRALDLDGPSALETVPIHFGRTLCGNFLLDDPKARQELITRDPSAIGYEMEGAGVARTAHDQDVPWIMVKAISDWGDGEKGRDKEILQRKAAYNAALVVRLALDRGPVDRGGGGPSPKVKGPRAALEPLPKLRDPVEDSDYVRSVRGLATSLKAGDAAEAGGDGLPVMETLHKWVEDPAAPPLFALLGEYGMGKTVTCQRLYRELRDRREADPTRRQPLYYDLKDLTRLNTRTPTLTETIEECVDRGWSNARGSDYGLDYVLARMNEGAVVIFDGLDEVLVKLTAADGQAFTNGLLQLVGDYRTRHPKGPAPRVLLSCRTQFFRTLDAQRGHFVEQDRGGTRAESYRALTLLPFTETQVMDYLRKTLPNEDPERLVELISSVHNLEDLSRRPYTLKLIRNFIPDIERDRAAGRAIHGVSLYRRMVESWLARDAGKHHIRPQDKNRLAAHLAAHLWRRGQSGIAVSELEDWLHLWLTEDPALQTRYSKLHPEQLEEDLRTATFLRRRDADDPSEGLFTFAHTSLQEFFLADYLLEAIKGDRPDRWSMPTPSLETMDFLGQLLLIGAYPQATKTLQTWSADERPTINRNILAYALRASKKHWPSPILRGINLENSDLREWRIAGQNLTFANFSGANLRGTEFRRCQLDYAIFVGADLVRSEFLDGSAAHCDFTKANLVGATFHAMTLTSATVAGALQQRTKWLRSDITGIHLPQPPLALIADCIPSSASPAGRISQWVELDGHSDSVNACAFSADGRRIVSAGDDNAVRIWDAESGEVLIVLEGHVGAVNACEFSPDGRNVVSAGQERAVRVWDAASGKALAVLEGHARTVNACSFSPDGRRVVSAGDDGTVRIWDAASGASLVVLEGHEDWVRACAFSPDGSRVVSAGDDGTVRIWDAVSGQLLAVLTGHEGWVLACAFSPEGHRIVSAGNDNAVRIWDVASGETLAIWGGHESVVNACTFSPEGNRILSAGDDNTVRIWDATTGEVLGILDGHLRAVNACAFSQDGRSIVSASDDKTVRIWDAASGEPLAALEGHRSWMQTCGFSPDGRRIVSGGIDATVRIWDAVTGEALTVLEGHQDWVRACAFSPDGRRVVSAGDDNTVRIWDAASGETLAVLAGHKGWVRACAFSPDGQRIVSAGDDKAIQIWDAASGESLAVLVADEEVLRTCAFSPDGRRIVSAGDFGDVQIWDVASGKVQAELKGHAGSVYACSFSADGRRIVSAGPDRTVRIWDLESGNALAVMEGHERAVNACTFSPDGRCVVSAGSDSTVRIWDAVSGEALAVLRGHEDWVVACAFSPDGRRIVSAGDDGTVRIWDAGKPSESHRIRHFSDGSWISLDLVSNRVIEAEGEAWRWLGWVDPEHPEEGPLPAEIFGPLPSPKRLRRAA